MKSNIKELSGCDTQTGISEPDWKYGEETD